MGRDTFNTLFYLRRNKVLKDGTVPIFMRITINGKRWDSSLQLGVDLNNWDTKKERAIGNVEGSDIINNKIESLKFRLHKIKTNIEEEGKTMTIGLVKTKFLGQEKLQRTIIQLFESHNDECKKKVGVKITRATHVKYVTCLKHTQDFLRKVYKVDDLPISEIDKDFYDKFEFFLLTYKKCAHNSTIKYILNFNKIVKIAVEKGWLSKSPYREMGYHLEEVDKPYLTIEELNSIIKKEINVKRLDIIRDIFVFCCYTGLAFSDVKELTLESIQVGVDNNKWIIKKRHKTNIVSKIPLLDTPAKIVEKYQEYPRSSDSTRILPVPSNQKTNAYLKEIADLTGIKKTLTTHTARRTFATTIMLKNGVSMEAVSKMLGHTSLFMTRKYAKVDEYYIAKETEKIRKMFN
jgi:site-specific recombinase XerD